MIITVRTTLFFHEREQKRYLKWNKDGNTASKTEKHCKNFDSLRIWKINKNLLETAHLYKNIRNTLSFRVWSGSNEKFRFKTL